MNLKGSFLYEKDKMQPRKANFSIGTFINKRRNERRIFITSDSIRWGK
jgi:hypothetical protein